MKIDLAVDFGVQDAFIVAYSDGKRISLAQAQKIKAESGGRVSKSTSQINKSDIKFKIQVGSYKDQLPTDVLSILMQLEAVDQAELDGGLTRYTVGDFSSFKDAEEYREIVIKSGIGGAFIIAFSKDKLIPVSQAKEVLGE